MDDPRKVYGSQEPDVTAHMHTVGDPVFKMDSQNNDEHYRYDTDKPNDLRDTDGINP